MRILIIGGTGLLGSEGAKALLQQGHDVTALSLSGAARSDLPTALRYIQGDYVTMTEEEYGSLLPYYDVLIFAAGVDERQKADRPVYDFFKDHNITPLERMLNAARVSNVKHVVVLGSYFTHFNRELPELALCEHHPYIRSRAKQAELALSFADDNMKVSVLEIPYVFGVQEGREPLWTFLVKQILEMQERTIYPVGGTTMVTAKQVGQAIAGVVNKAETGNYPLGYYNMEWTEMLEIIHASMGTPNKPIVSLPADTYIQAMKIKGETLKEQGVELGLDVAEYAKLSTRNLFVNNQTTVQLGVKPDDIEDAIRQSVQLSLKYIEVPV